MGGKQGMEVEAPGPLVVLRVVAMAVVMGEVAMEAEMEVAGMALRSSAS